MPLNFFFFQAKYGIRDYKVTGVKTCALPICITPIAVEKHLQLLPQVFSLDLPQDLIEAVYDAKDKAAIRQVGIEWAIAQSKELMAAGVPVLHYYSMGKSSNIEAIAAEVF